MKQFSKSGDKHRPVAWYGNLTVHYYYSPHRKTMATKQFWSKLCQNCHLKVSMLTYLAKKVAIRLTTLLWRLCVLIQYQVRRWLNFDHAQSVHLLPACQKHKRVIPSVKNVDWDSVHFALEIVNIIRMGTHVMDLYLFPLKELIKGYDRKNPTRTLLGVNQVKTELEDSDIGLSF